MAIPIIIFLLLYLMMVTFFILFSIFLLYHAVATMANMTTMIIYLAVSAGLLFFSYIYIARIDWSLKLIIF